jgi:hypothetical protein
MLAAFILFTSYAIAYAAFAKLIDQTPIDPKAGQKS